MRIFSILRIVLFLALFFAGVLWFHHSRQNRPLRVDVARENGILLWGNGTDPQTIDPHLATGVPEHHVIDTIIEGLVTPHPDHSTQVNPGVAERWEALNEARTWVFYLRKDAKWSNGDPVTADDFVYSYQRILTPALAGEYSSMLYPILNAEAFNKGTLTDFSQVGVKARDPHTLELTFRASMPHLLPMLVHYAWYPVHPPTIEKFGGMASRLSQWTRPGNFVGNGPFQLKSWHFNHLLVVEKNPHYWDRENVGLNEIHFLQTTVDSSEERAFRDGKLHITNTLPLNLLPKYREQKSPSLYLATGLITSFYRLNLQVKPLDDVRVRRALALSVDRHQLIQDLLKGGQTPATGITPPGIEGYDPLNEIPFDPKEARRLLAEAGYPGGKGFPTLKILYNTSETHRTVAQALQENWRTILGINLQLSNQEWGVYLSEVSQQKYDLARAGWQADFPDPSTFLNMWRTGDGNNNTGWSNPEFDRLLMESEQCATQEERFKILREAEILFLKETPIVPLTWSTKYYLVDPRLENWRPNPLDVRPPKMLRFKP